MARTKIQQRQEAERARIARYDADLKQPRPPRTVELDAIVRAVVSGREASLVRDPADWSGKIKSRDPGRIALSLARHCFAIYRTPAHLERVWLRDERLDAGEEVRRVAWYLDVAQGRSLYRTRTRFFLTKRETHLFLNPPVAMGFREALWFAITRSSTENFGIAMRIARSKIARDAVLPFWRDASRFFAVNPAPLNEIDDLCDFFAARLAEDEEYSLKGRTLASLRAQMSAWHADLARARRIGGGSWPGNPLEDWSEKVPGPKGASHKDVTWLVTQIKTGDDLAEEGRRMRHCVASYKHSCISGRCSVWSLRKRTFAGTERVLTMEMNAHNALVQVRGFTNRLATAEELRILRQWASQNLVVGV